MLFFEALVKPGRDARPARPRLRGTRDPTRCAEGFASASFSYVRVSLDIRRR